MPASELPERDQPSSTSMIVRSPLSCPCCGAAILRRDIAHTLGQLPPALAIACGSCNAPLSVQSGFTCALIGSLIGWFAMAGVCYLAGFSIGLIPLLGAAVSLVLFLRLVPFLGAFRVEQEWAWMADLAQPPQSSADARVRRYRLEHLDQRIRSGFMLPASSAHAALEWIAAQQQRLEASPSAQP